MPATKTTHDIALSHFRADVRTTLYGEVRFRAATTERRIPGGWKPLADIEIPDDVDLFVRTVGRGDLQEYAETINRLCTKLLMQDKQQKASYRAARLRRKERKREAQAEYKAYLEQLPISAEAYREDADRYRYSGDPNGHATPRSMTDWLDRKARERWPEATQKKKRQIREKHDLGAGTSLIY